MRQLSLVLGCLFTAGMSCGSEESTANTHDALVCQDGLVPYEGECLAEPPPCGQPPGPCVATRDATECNENGGYFDTTWQYCYCSTSDGGCPCWLPGHCQGFCLGDEGDVDACRSTVVGRCSDSNNTGCFCTADHMGYPHGFELVCIN